MATNFTSTLLANVTLGKIYFTHDCEGAVKIYPALQAMASGRTQYFTDHSLRAAYSASATNAPFPYDVFIGVLRSVKEDPFRSVSAGVIVDWIDNLNTTSTEFHDAVKQIGEVCSPEYCRSLAWQGNPDLAGVGAFTSLVMGVGLSSLFALAIVSQRLLRLFSKSKDDKAHNSFQQAIRTSFGVFWDSAFLFNMSVTIAAVVSITQDPSPYNKEFTILSMSISWTIIASTWPLYAPICRHPTAHWVGIWAATVAFTIISIVTLSASFKGETPFEESCLRVYAAESEMRQTAQFMSNQAPLGLQVCGLSFSCTYLWKGIWYLARTRWSKSRLPKKSRWVSNRDNIWRRRWRIAVAVAWSTALFVLMIICLVSFALKREMTAEVAGPSLEESKWGFGQVMALATWVPTAVDFVMIIQGK
ncbi:hypothetical protein V8F06_013632 [Rhypophila decipiens]